jgi:hypothetical protein
MNLAVNLLRLVTGLLSIGGMVLISLLILLRSTWQFAKEGAGVLGYVAQLFTSGFTKGTPPPEPAGWIASVPQIGLLILFATMLVSLFFPTTKTFLHVLAAATGVASLWYAWMLCTQVRVEIVCLPTLVVWFVYYAVCLKR